MSFEITTTSPDESFEYDTDSECVVEVSMVSTAPFQMIYRGHCSECMEEVEVVADPISCPGCGRHIVDWRGE